MLWNRMLNHDTQTELFIYIIWISIQKMGPKKIKKEPKNTDDNPQGASKKVEEKPVAQQQQSQVKAAKIENTSMVP